MVLEVAGDIFMIINKICVLKPIIMLSTFRKNN